MGPPFESSLGPLKVLRRPWNPPVAKVLEEQKKQKEREKKNKEKDKDTSRAGNDTLFVKIVLLLNKNV